MEKLSRTPEAELTIRQAHAGEFEAVREFYTVLIDRIRNTRYYPRWQIGIHPSDLMLKSAVAQGEMYLALRGKQIIGAMIVNHTAGDGYNSAAWPTGASRNEALVIHVLGVMPEDGRKGVGTAMVEAAIRLGRAQNMKAIRLDVLKGNLPAVKLYLRAGFVYVETIKLFYEVTGLSEFELYEYAL